MKAAIHLSKSKLAAGVVLLALPFIAFALARVLPLDWLYASETKRIAGFFALSAMAIAVPRPATIGIWIAFVISGIFYANATGKHRWPFESWRLYNQPFSQTETYQILYVGDGRGKLYRYDDRALGAITTAVNLRRWAGEIPALKDEETQEEIAEHFLRQANRYRRQILDDDRSVFAGFAFPLHQYGYAWDLALLSESAEFEQVVITETTITFSEQGRSIADRQEKEIWRYPNVH